MSNNTQVNFHFCSEVYKSYNPEFLDVCLNAFNEGIERTKKDRNIDLIYPVIMTDNLNTDTKLADFITYINQLSWNILDNQGYDVQNFNTYANELWGQEHHTTSSMEYHFHTSSKISGFYFLEVPENSSQLIFHDPRQLKQFNNDLPIKQVYEITQSSNWITYDVVPGDLLFTDSWLPHSFTRNRSELPFKFIHFNVYCYPVNNQIEAVKQPIIV